ncbi:DNA-binding helix-turn-helix protein [Sphingobacterium spiritivorum ATCC 33300]|uniref:DNA-binding helix-turn-helix protein n=1 Tax=Sphingobacterium spiritivorum ATCC 33300 TaxID=525372 RepID=C2G3R0_SPHSI|nr:helix-turn-helix domain-containing protein [Sphingobacterium spiritivorum]EEI90265.1 DNA-binding helix-turn-helix protein [Sphingobacterium spiritivorum ATCC 33300]QQS95107.1 helix-turn-helix domain-containing protein [Sphingobacterium spiritivorum]
MKENRTSFNLSQKRSDKGLTQQKLAELAGLTTRTIQRIEKGEVIPQGYTLQRIAEALDISIEELSAEIRKNNKDTQASNEMVSLFHFLPLTGLIFPFGNILFPLFLWIYCKQKNLQYDVHGRISLNFQFTITILMLLAIVLLVIYFPVGFFLLVLTTVTAIILCVVNGIRSFKNLKPRYYCFFPFLKPVPENSPE